MHDWNQPDAREWAGRKISIVDETLRDGLQSPSAIDPPIGRKIAILHAMAGIGVDAVSVGLPAAGARAVRDAIELAKEIVKERLPFRPTAAARTMVNDVNAVVEVSQSAGVPVESYSFIGSSPIRTFTESWSTDWLLARVRESGEAARKGEIPYCLVLEDTTRTPPALLVELFKAAVDVGAGRICLCDTVGHADAGGAAALVAFARKTLDESGAQHVELDWHGHNDRGLALSNALSAMRAGASGIHGTAGGIGERTGNVPMDHLVLQLGAMRVRRNPSRPALHEYMRLALEAIDAPTVARRTPIDEPVTPLSMTVNGDPVAIGARPSRTLLEVLRYDLDLVGTKQGCDEGDCGACTVLVDGEPTLSCLTLALSCEGRAIETVESLPGAPKLHPLLDAFDRHGAGQCGFCTSGMLMSGEGLLRRDTRPSRDAIKLAISGNLCRCTGYGAIVEAIDDAAHTMGEHQDVPLPGEQWAPLPLAPHGSGRRK